MQVSKQPRIGIIGAGKVGSVLARLLYAKGYTTAAVYSRRPESAVALAEQTAAHSVSSPAHVIARADLTLLTVPDDALAPLAGTIAQQLAAQYAEVDMTKKAVVHTSGAHNRDVLLPLAECGLLTGSLHPAFPFADIQAGLDRLAGSAFAVEAGDALVRGWLLEIISALAGRAIEIPSDKKALYHAALVFTSNYTVVLYALAERLLISLGAERTAADQALNALLAGTVDNLRAKGVPLALTGPLTREDVGTVAAHMEALSAVDPALARVYSDLARLAYPLLRERGISIDAVEEFLRLWSL